MPDSVPWSRTFPALTVPAGESAYCFELGVPHRGSIERFVIEQISGSLDGFTVDMFDTREICPPSGSESVAASTEVGERMHKVFPTKSVDEGEVAIEDFDGSWEYVNRDGSPALPKRYLYLRITPGGDASAEKKFDMALTIRPPLLT